MSKNIARIHTMMKGYRKKLRHIWEEYSFMEYYAPYIHSNIKDSKFPTLEFQPFLSNDIIRKTKKDTSLGVLGQVMQNSIKHRVLLDSIATFEDYLCKLAEIVYLDYPDKLKNLNKGQTEKEAEKYLHLIIDSDNKDDILSKIIEEKLRSIFYGNPLELFEKDKMKLSFGKEFINNHPHILEEYKEITARRNVIVHNNGRVDRKYIREIKNTQFKLGNKIQLDKKYLKRTLSILDGLAAISSKLVVRNIYGGQAQSKLLSSVNSFENGIGKKIE